MNKPLYGVRFASFLCAAVFFLVLLFTHADLAMDGVRRGISLCTETLFPSLFPFLVLSELLVAMHAGELLSRLFSRPVSRLFGLSGNAAAALLLGAFCGLPTAMTGGMALYRKGEIGKRELQRLLLFANNPSSGFLIGAVGEALFGNRRAGVMLYAITLFSSLLIGVFLRVFCGSVIAKKSDIPPYVMRKSLSPADFTGSVTRGFSTLLQVSAFLLFFAAVIGCLSALPAFAKLPPCFRALLAGGLEMTSGISLAASSLPPGAAYLLTAFLTGFAGLSVCLQLFSVTEGAELRLLPYLAAKCAHGLLNTGFAALYLFLRKPELSPAKSVFSPIGAFPPENIPRLLLPSLVCLTLFFAAALLTAWKKTTGTPRGNSRKNEKRKGA